MLPPSMQSHRLGAAANQLPYPFRNTYECVIHGAVWIRYRSLRIVDRAFERVHVAVWTCQAISSPHVSSRN